MSGVSLWQTKLCFIILIRRIEGPTVLEYPAIEIFLGCVYNSCRRVAHHDREHAEVMSVIRADGTRSIPQAPTITILCWK
jgi:hypothetical protein